MSNPFLPWFDGPYLPIDPFDTHRIVASQIETVGCAFGSVFGVIPTLEFCAECWCYHAQGQHTIPLDEAVEVVKSIAAANRAALEEDQE
jgi:hypothetical protein